MSTDEFYLFVRECGRRAKARRIRASMFPLSLPANAVGVTFKGRTFNQVVSRNTVPGEMPWRVTRLDADGVMGHTAMLTLCGAVRYAILDDGEVIEVVTQ